MLSKSSGMGIFTALVLMVAVSAGAADITWQTPATVTSVDSIDTTGTLVEARSGGPDAQATQNVTVGSETIAFEAMDLARITQGGGTNQAEGFVPPGAFDAAFETVLDTFSYDGANPKVITLTGLTVGNDYQIQIFVSDDRGCCSGRTMTVSDPNGNASAEFSNVDSIGVIGVFTADAATQLVHINGIAQDQTNMNAYVLRDLSSGGGGEPIPQEGIVSNVYSPYIDEGTTVILTSEEGTGYQWAFNGVDIVGATDRELVLDPITEEDAGSYSVTYDDGTGVVTDTIEVTVNPEGSVPVAGGLGLVALLGACALGGASLLRRRQH